MVEFQTQMQFGDGYVEATRLFGHLQITLRWELSLYTVQLYWETQTHGLELGQLCPGSRVRTASFTLLVWKRGSGPHASHTQCTEIITTGNKERKQKDWGNKKWERVQASYWLLFQPRLSDCKQQKPTLDNLGQKGSNRGKAEEPGFRKARRETMGADTLGELQPFSIHSTLPRLGFFGKSIRLARREQDTMGGSLPSTLTKTGGGMSFKENQKQRGRILSMEETAGVYSLSKILSLHL